MKPNWSTYEYALRSPRGRYYTGRVNSNDEPEAWLGSKHQAFTYTEQDAYWAKACFECFKNFTVERVH